MVYCCNGTARRFQDDMQGARAHMCVCLCVLAGDKGITSLEPHTIPHKHSLSQWEVYIICQFLSHEGASLRHEKRDAYFCTARSSLVAGASPTISLANFCITR
jgi:hypothetical protein